MRSWISNRTGICGFSRFFLANLKSEAYRTQIPAFGPISGLGRDIHRLRNMPLIVESFNDAAYPFNHAEDCDTVLCVASNTVLQFEERRYFEAIESHGREKPKLQLTLSQVYAPSLIKARFIVQPLTNDERNDPAKLTQNYSEVIKKVAGNS